MNRIFVKLKRKEKSYIGNKIPSFENHLILNQISEQDLGPNDEVHHALEMMSEELDWYQYDFN